MIACVARASLFCSQEDDTSLHSVVGKLDLPNFAEEAPPSSVQILNFACLTLYENFARPEY